MKRVLKCTENFPKRKYPQISNSRSTIVSQNVKESQIIIHLIVRSSMQVYLYLFSKKIIPFFIYIF